MRTLTFYKMQMREHLMNMLIGIGTFFGILFALSLLFTHSLSANATLNFNGFSFIVTLILGTMFWGNFRTMFQSALQYQLTRKQFALSTILLAVSLSMFLLLINIAFVQLMSKFAPSIGVEDPLFDVFLQFFRFLPAGMRWVGLIVLGFATNLLAIVAGLFFGTLAYRTRPAVSFTLFFGSLLVGPFIFGFSLSLLPFGTDTMLQIFTSFARLVGLYPLNGVRWSIAMYLVVLIGFVVFWFMTRRMELKRS